MAISSIVLLTALLAASTNVLGEGNQARAIDVLDKRTGLSGGWALINPSCPADTVTCDNFCCSTGSECNRNGYGNHCCPTGTSCLAAYQASPRCADDNWSLWRILNSKQGEGYFCCLPDQIGTNAYSCVTSDTPVVASLSASLVAKATGTAGSAEPATASGTTIVSVKTTSSAAVNSAAASDAQSSATTSASTTQTTRTSAGERNALALLGESVFAAMVAGAFAVAI